MTTLQERFVESKGTAVDVDGVQVAQMDALDLKRARVVVTAVAPRDDEGLAIKTPKGAIRLSNGTETQLLHIWFDSQLPLSATHEIDCRSGDLRIWNVYRNRHPGGRVTVDAWTGNAGMIVSIESGNRRRYRCSRGNVGHFDPRLEVVLEWHEL